MHTWGKVHSNIDLHHHNTMNFMPKCVIYDKKYEKLTFRYRLKFFELLDRDLKSKDMSHIIHGDTTNIKDMQAQTKRENNDSINNNYQSKCEDIIVIDDMSSVATNNNNNNSQSNQNEELNIKNEIKIKNKNEDLLTKESSVNSNVSRKVTRSYVSFLMRLGCVWLRVCCVLRVCVFVFEV